MSIISKYIGRKIVATTFGVTITLTVIIWLSQSYRYLEFILSPYISSWQYGRLLLLMVPDMMQMTVPLALSLATLLVYQRLAANQELICLKVLGFSGTQIMKPAFCIGSVVSVFILINSFFLIPPSIQLAREYEHTLRRHVFLNAIKPGQFNALGSMTCFLEHYNSKDGFKGIFVHMTQKDNPNHLVKTINAEKGHFIYSKDFFGVSLKNGLFFEDDLSNHKHTQIRFGSLIIDLGHLFFNQKREKKIYEHKTQDLLSPKKNLPQDLRHRMRSEGHQRIIQCILTIANLLAASIFVLRMDASRYQRRWTFFGGFLAVLLTQGVTFSLMNMISLKPYATVGIVLAYLWVGGVMGSIIYWLKKRCSSHMPLS
jgi:lipopolysaccharide export system permease protein